MKKKKTIFSHLFDKIRGKPNIFYGGDFSSKEVYTDDGHVRDFPSKDWKIKDKEGNYFIVLLYIINQCIEEDYERYTRTANSILSTSLIIKVKKHNFFPIFLLYKI